MTELKEIEKVYRKFVGKTNPEDESQWLPVYIHLSDTAGIMRHMAREWIPQSTKNAIGIDGEEFENICAFLGYVHDIGKFTAAFQRKILRCLAEQASFKKLIGVDDDFIDTKTTPHARAGEVILLSLGCNESFAAVVGAHHGKAAGEDVFADEMDEERKFDYYPDSEYRDLYTSVWKYSIDASLKQTGFNSIEDIPEVDQYAQMLLSGMIIAADWIASDYKNYFDLIPLESDEVIDLEGRVNTAWEKVKGVLSVPWESQIYSMDEDLFEEEFGFYPNSIQKEVMEIVNDSDELGIMIIEAHMGSGKTEAALSAAECIAARGGQGGIFFGLPTQATANGISPRIEAWGDKQSFDESHTYRLAHNGTVFVDEYQELLSESANVEEDYERESGLFVSKWIERKKLALLADFVVGTVDQFLMAALRQKHVMLRHLGLAGKVVIIDEVHAYDAYMNKYLERALKWMGVYKVPVILLSATLPCDRRKALIDAYMGNSSKVSENMPWTKNEEYPLITWSDGGAVGQRKVDGGNGGKRISIQFENDGMIKVHVGEVLEAEGCIGIVVNTVKRAQTIARELREEFPESEIIEFHSRFIMTDRAVIEETLMDKLGKGSTIEDRRGVIVVGTQVIEQSLDIDFDYLITELCPMDLLLQRIGRLHRHERIRPKELMNPVCGIIVGENGKADDGSIAVYSEFILERTRMRLEKVNTICIPEDIAPLVQETYNFDKKDFCNIDEGEYSNLKHMFESETKKKEQRAGNFLLDVPKKSKRSKTIHRIFKDASVESKGREAVRDTDFSIEVILLKELDEDRICFAQNESKVFDKTIIPSYVQRKEIRKQRIKLPQSLTKNYIVENTIKCLEKRQMEVIPEWIKGGEFGGELFLILDDNAEALVNDYWLQYSKTDGLKYERRKANG